MNARKFKLLGLTIISIVLLVIAIQAYTIYKNYLGNKELYITKVQTSLDNSLEKYYAELAKTDVISFTDLSEVNFSANANSSDSLSDSTVVEAEFFQRFLDSKLIQEEIRAVEGQPVKKDSIFKTYIKNEKLDGDSILMVDKFHRIAISRGQVAADSISDIAALTNKIIISIKRDTIDSKTLEGLLNAEFDRQNLPIEYTLEHFRKDSLTGSFGSTEPEALSLITYSKSTFLPPNQKIKLSFENATMSILQLGIFEILFSIVFTIIIVGVLFYLYNIIKTQKDLSNIKNDLINNITHEFKTPIATVSTALEGIQNFNKNNDPIKTAKYIDISIQQLNKLHIMVEKLLETATLDQEKLLFSNENFDLTKILNDLTIKYQSIAQEKVLILNSALDSIHINGDPFHLENALSNIIDNAIKYGGNKITISLNQYDKTEIIIEDNGGNLPNDQQTRVFEQFYRIPKGNIHDIKGFGIGLFYTKKIIEQHKGVISLELGNNLTRFKITLP